MDITAYVIKNAYGEYFSFGVDYNPIWVNIYDAYYCTSLDHAYDIVMKFGGEVYRVEMTVVRN